MNERRQTDPERIRQSLKTLDRMPGERMYYPEAREWGYNEGDTRGLLVLLRGAIKQGAVDLYTAGPGPDYTYNVWDYESWDRLEVHEWLSREIERAAKGQVF